MDQQILFFINHRAAHPALDRIMAAASSFDLWWPILLVAALVVFLAGGFRMRAMLLTAGLAIAVTDGVVVKAIKEAVGRPRPNEVLEGVRVLDLARGEGKPRLLVIAEPLQEHYSVSRIHPGRGNSFPSAHAASNFAFAAVCLVYYRRWGWIALLPATLVAYSRIYVGSHWPLDIAFSCLLGAGIGFLMAILAEWTWRGWGGRLLPGWHAAHPSLIAT